MGGVKNLILDLAEDLRMQTENVPWEITKAIEEETPEHVTHWEWAICLIKMGRDFTSQPTAEEITAWKKTENKGKKDEKMKHFELCQVSLPVQFQDSGRWRSYHLSTEGSTEAELILNGYISEIDQDGGEIRDYPLDDASGELIECSMDMIKELGAPNGISQEQKGPNET